MISPWKLGSEKPRTISCTGPIAIVLLSLSLRISLKYRGALRACIIRFGLERPKRPTIPELSARPPELRDE